MFWSTHERMKVRALQHDEGRIVVLALVVLAAAMCVGAIVAELGVVKNSVTHRKMAKAKGMRAAYKKTCGG